LLFTAFFTAVFFAAVFFVAVFFALGLAMGELLDFCLLCRERRGRSGLFKVAG
jgi:hypothetical protein